MPNTPKREPTRQERWRERNAVKMRAYQRDLMRVRRAAAKAAEAAQGDDLKPQASIRFCVTREQAATMHQDELGADAHNRAGGNDNASTGERGDDVEPREGAREGERESWGQ